MSVRKGTYKRQLPSGLTAYCSDEGKVIFTEALDQGHMGVYFKMAANFQTQSELAYCGLSSLVMAYNTLKDPDIAGGWWCEHMLHCYINLDMVRKTGITFGQLLYLAECIGLAVDGYSTHNMSDDCFRSIIRSATSTDEKVVIANFHRSSLGQTGSGHVAPLGGYNVRRDMLLVMDVARFKYMPHWVPLLSMKKAIDTVDGSTNERRGFCVVSLAKNVKPHLFFMPNLLVIVSQVDVFVHQWVSWLSRESSEHGPSELLQEAVIVLGACAKGLDEESFVLTHEALHECSAEHLHSTRGLFDTIRVSDLYSTLHAMAVFSSVEWKSVYLRMWRGLERRHPMAREVTAPMVTTLMLYSWPYCVDAQASTNAARLAKLIENSIAKQSIVLQREVAYLRQQLLFKVSQDA
eukprot:Em0018g65a